MRLKNKKTKPKNCLKKTLLDGYRVNLLSNITLKKTFFKNNDNF